MYRLKLNLSKYMLDVCIYFRRFHYIYLSTNIKNVPRKYNKRITLDISKQFIIYKNNTNTQSQTFLPSIKMDKPLVIRQYIM